MEQDVCATFCNQTEMVRDLAKKKVKHFVKKRRRDYFVFKGGANAVVLEMFEQQPL